jgi:glycosyltransferase involved in cell wall biosynthesis
MHTEYRTAADVIVPESPVGPLNVVLGGTPLLGRLTGIGRYTYELARALAASQIVDDLRLWGDLSFLDAGILKRDDPSGEDPAGLADKKIRERSGSLAVSARAFASRSYYASMVYQYVTGAMAERRLRPLADSHLYHSPNFIMPHFDGARVITIHDLSTIRFPQFHRKQMVVLCEGGIHSAIEGKAHVITDSFLVRDELVNDFGVDSSQVSTVHLAPDPRCRPRHESECRQALDALGLRHKAFFLSVGTVEPRKNLLRVFEAFRAGRRANHFDWPLIVVGASGWKSSKEHEMLDGLINDGLALYLDYVADDTLLNLYASAGALVFPSLYEGFGLPALEAAACGCPVITSERSAMAEFAPEETLFVNPEDVSSISGALKAIPSKPEFGSGFDAGTQAAARTWVDVAQETSEVYRAALRS